MPTRTQKFIERLGKMRPDAVLRRARDVHQLEQMSARNRLLQQLYQDLQPGPTTTGWVPRTKKR